METNGVCFEPGERVTKPGDGQVVAENASGGSLLAWSLFFLRGLLAASFRPRPNDTLFAS